MAINNPPNSLRNMLARSRHERKARRPIDRMPADAGADWLDWSGTPSCVVVLVKPYGQRAIAQRANGWRCRNTDIQAMTKSTRAHRMVIYLENQLFSTGICECLCVCVIVCVRVRVGDLRNYAIRANRRLRVVDVQKLCVCVRACLAILILHATQQCCRYRCYCEL